MRTALLALMLGLGASLTVSQTGGAPAIAWDASVEAVSGYVIERGAQCGTWTTEIDVGNVTQHTLTASEVDLTVPSCFVVRAYRDDPTTGARVYSSDSNTATFTPAPVAPAPDPRCDVLGDRHVGVFVTSWRGTTGQPGSKAHVDFQLASPNSPIVSIAVALEGATGTMVTGSDLTSGGSQWFTVPATSGDYALSVRATNAYGCTTTQTKDALGSAMSVTVK